MTDQTTATNGGLALLRTPFPPNQISKLPKRNNKTGTTVQLDYVGHAALTDRLLDADPAWTWEPFAVSPEGLPVIDNLGGMWIRLTVCGVTRIGYGHAGEKQGGDAIKEVIGDALRNAGMRFGAALDLWHKGDLHVDGETETDPLNQPKNFGLTGERAKVVRAAAGESIQKFNEGNEYGAFEAVSWIDDPAEMDALWSILYPHSALRSCLKRLDQEQRKRDAELTGKMAVQDAVGLEPLLQASIDKIAETKIERMSPGPGLKKIGVRVPT